MFAEAALAAAAAGHQRWAPDGAFAPGRAAARSGANARVAAPRAARRQVKRPDRERISGASRARRRVAAAGSLIHDAQMAVNGIIGVGVYTVPQASRLARVSSARIRRWLRGYEFARKDGRGRSAPVWRAQLPKVDDTIALGFLDLMEVRFVDAFLEAGLSLKKIRRAAKLATELVGRDHPFSTQKFRTDGKRIFAEIEHDDRKGDKSLYDLEQHQFGIYEVIVPSLLEG